MPSIFTKVWKGCWWRLKTLWLWVGPKYGEIPVVPQGVTYPQSTPRGGLYLSASDPNPGILHVDTDAYTLGLDPIAADLGDTFLGAVRGVIGYSYGKVHRPAGGRTRSVQRNALAKESTTLIKDEDKLSVASFQHRELSPG
jgi:hypothetical protein